MNDVVVRADELQAFVSAVLRAVDVDEEDAAITADVLVAADLRGHESHGVARLEHFYVRRLQTGRVAARAALTIQRDTAATLLLDAGNGLGHPATKRAMDLCIARARTAGMCMASIRHSNHFGIAAYYAMQALPHDMIGICCTNASDLVVPTGGRTPLLGTNPIAFAAPAGTQHPFVLDMATSVVPLGKIEVKARRGEALPLGWAVDGMGQPATDAEAVLEGIAQGQPGGLMPLGGTDAGHKGYGLSAMVDILCGILAGARSGLLAPAGTEEDVGHVVAAIDLAAFGAADQFKRALDAYIERLHRAPRAVGAERIVVAGEPEFDAAERRRREGIPLQAKVAESLRALGHEFGLSLAGL